MPLFVWPLSTVCCLKLHLVTFCCGLNNWPWLAPHPPNRSYDTMTLPWVSALNMNLVLEPHDFSFHPFNAHCLVSTRGINEHRICLTQWSKAMQTISRFLPNMNEVRTLSISHLFMNLIFKMWVRGTLKPSDIFCTRVTVILCWPSDFILFHPPWVLSYNMYAQIPCLNYHTLFFFLKKKQ